MAIYISMTEPKFNATRKKLYLRNCQASKWVEVKGHTGQVQGKAHDIGRLAHVNMKCFIFSFETTL